MPSPRAQAPGRPHLERDQQQWVFDYIIQQSRQVFHWWSSDIAEKLPEGTRSHAMISKYSGREGQAREAEARQAEARGKKDQALRIYFEETDQFIKGQHAIFEINEEKQFLYSGVQRCYDKVRELAPYPIERIDVPWNGTIVSGWLHLLPHVTKAPLCIYIPGCDMNCEQSPSPMNNTFHESGMHVFSFDGPGQGQSNMRGIKLTSDNYESAASAVLDYLISRPEVDANRIVVLGDGFGSWWALRFVAFDHRPLAVATKTTYADLYYIMNEESLRWKQLFAFLMQAKTEEELDAELEKMTLNGYMEQITCAVLMMDGEYNLRDPIEEVFDTFDRLKAPAELWVFADCFNRFVMPDGSALRPAMVDWLRDRLDNKPMAHAGDVLYLETGGAGPNSPDVQIKRRWFEESR